MHYKITKFPLLVLMLLISNSYLFAQLNHGLFPLIQNASNRKTISLNGSWKVIIDPFESGFYNHRYLERADGYFLNEQPQDKTERIEYNFDESINLEVPGDWNSQLEKLLYYEGTVWYKKSFDYNHRKNTRVFVHFGAINYEAIIYLNGEKIGKHTGGFTPFNIELTGLLKKEDNFLVIKADNQRKKEAVPTVNMDWWNYGGITRSVDLIEVPETFISDYQLKLGEKSKGHIVGFIETNGPGSQSDNQALIRIPELGIEEAIKIKDHYAEFSIKSQPELWSPDNPKRYSVEIIYGDELLNDQIGFRTISTQGTSIQLNGSPIFLRGICIHEEAPFQGGRAYSIEDDRTLLEWAKDLGCNFVRLAHYTHNENMIREADRLGLLVWSEIPVYWTVDFENQVTLENAKNQLSESISRDKNRSSVVIWSVANETPQGPDRLSFIKSLIDHAHALDETRLVSAATDSHGDSKNPDHLVLSDPLSQYLDVIGLNYYCGWYQGLPQRCPGVTWESPYNKPVIVSEFGGGAKQGFHGDSLTRWSEEYQASVYENNLKMIENMPFVAGMTPWLLMDFSSSKRPLPNIQDNYNRKGLISERGIKKAAFFTLKSFYQQYQKGDQ